MEQFAGLIKLHSITLCCQEEFWESILFLCTLLFQMYAVHVKLKRFGSFIIFCLPFITWGVVDS